MKQMTRLAIISNQAFSLINFRGPLIRELVDAGVQVDALAPDYDADTRAGVAALGARPVDYSLARAGVNPFSDGVDTLRLALLLRRLRPDATLGYFIKPVIYGTFAAWLARVPRRYSMIEGLGFVFSDGGEQLSPVRRLLRAMVRGLYRSALARADRVVFLNREDIDDFVRAGLVDEHKTHCLGGIGVDLAEWSPAPAVTTPVTFVLAARLLREKGIVEYVEAAARVKNEYPDVRFVLLGGLDPNPGGLSRREVESWVQAGLIEWPGHVPVRPWLAQASVFVLPSYYREGVPRSTQEAMAMARPVITTDAPGCRDTVVEGKNGFLVPMRDVDSLVGRMLAFVREPSLIETMGRSSRELAESRFDVHLSNAALMRIMGFSGGGEFSGSTTAGIGALK
ncbi:MAG TPA: glycosyltransferase family 4 protein [Aromatoleum sp.]|uniref:glycosyltransferase family 4 protein n=1 Tax=Aromatoleum sp. TaxID=2307007 RepID=UPI002B48CEBE|nr:glycosyltransferase family 4 protein [Aromatoleum sp.]HJV25102.1 glycosyltransferase family 4 protein [Aromatoleum sp.]